MLASTNKGNGWIRRLPSWQSLTAACTALLGRPPPTSQQPRYRRFLLRRDDSTSIRSSCVLQVGETSPNFTIHKFPFVHLQHVLHGDCRLPCWPPDDYYGGSVNHQSFSLRQPFVRFNFKCGTQRCALHRGCIDPESAAKR